MPEFLRTFDDADRVRLSTPERTHRFGPLESTGCAHGNSYQFRYEWPGGSGGPHDGELVILASNCVDCVLAGWMQPGRRRA